MKYMEVSSLSGCNVDDSFMILINEIIDKKEENQQRIYITEKSNMNNKNSCY